MARAAVVLCALIAAGCSDHPYVIGRFPDGGLDECASTYAGAIRCTGFEQAGLSDWSGTTIEGAGAIERSTARAHRGLGALHASSAAASSVAVVFEDFAPLRSGELYLRAYLYVPSGLATDTMNLFFIGDDSDPKPDGSPFTGVDLNLLDGAVQVYAPDGDPMRQTGTLAIPRQRWFCFRARIVISQQQGEVHAFVDDQAALDASGLDTLPDAGVHRVRAGVDWSSQDAFFEVFMDDLVIDDRPVPC